MIDKDSFLRAETELAHLQDADLLRTKPAILVANKIDLARSRAVSPQGTLSILIDAIFYTIFNI